MNSYSAFLKANPSVLFLLNSINGMDRVRVCCNRQSLPHLFAEHYGRFTGQRVELLFPGQPQPKARARTIFWQLQAAGSEDGCHVIIPPISQRSSDLEPLVNYFFGRLDLSRSELSFLRNERWDGDLLQMEAVAEAKRIDPQADLRGLVLVQEDELVLRNLCAINGLGYWRGLINELGLKGVTDLFADQLINQQLEECTGKVSVMARMLQVPATTLYSRITARRSRTNAA